MRDGWTQKHLGEICRFQAGDAFGKSEQGRQTGDHPFIKVSDMNLSGNELYIANANNWVTDDESHTNYRLHPKDAVVFAKIGIALTYNRRRRLTRPTVIDNNMMSAMCLPGIKHTWFYYLLSTLDFNLISSGSALPYLTVKDLSRISVEVPPPQDQEAIGCILGALDDKIELNRRMNETLETIARAIFKDWFVDFGPIRAKADDQKPYLESATWSLFPNRIDDQGKPEGWEVQTIDSFAEQVAMGPFGSSIKVATFVPDGIPVISGQHLWGIQLEDSDFNFVTETHASQLQRSNVQRGDVVFTHAGSIGQACYIPDTSRYARYIISQRQFYLRCNRATMSPIYIVYYFNTPEGQHKLLANTSSTGVPSISRPVSNLRQITLVVPPIQLLNIFDDLIRPLHRTISYNLEQSRALETTRDFLLPKLISGEIPQLSPHFFEG